MVILLNISTPISKENTQVAGCLRIAVADLYNLIQIPISVSEPLPELEQFGRSQLEGKAPALAPALAQA